ncbi:NADH pyrophosphatase [Ceratocystis pirilliformis]|uniref:NAD(+) diphosphatase n=1 Tax=Ceratocystis pirilliformis TaxID=259994 RepID=A0ABR3ZMD1_9PEZI
MSSSSAVTLIEPLAPDSMLSKHFGRGLINYFSGTKINRLSFLRGDHTFLSAAYTHPETQFVLLRDLVPAVKDSASLALFKHTDVAPLTGKNPFETPEDAVIKAYDSTKDKPLVLFLGVEENEGAGFEYKTYRGQPWFAVDVTPRGTYKEAAQHIIDHVGASGIEFMKNPRAMSLKATDAATYSQARSLLDWNARNQFCSGCGGSTFSVQAGYKRVCPPTDFLGRSEATTRSACHTRVGVANMCFPRYDPVMIAAVISADGKRVLLGRQARYPKKWYSTLAGFVEQGESVEDAVIREVWEESGVRVGRVVLHSTQPWPYPASLMIGAVAQALPGGEGINLSHDAELEDAKWYPFDEVRRALKIGTFGLDDAAQKDYEGLKLPPHTAIAHQLLAAVVAGFGNPTASI